MKERKGSPFFMKHCI